MSGSADDTGAEARQRALRDAFGTFVTGVTVVTTCDAEGELAGCTANSFSSVSIDPPLVLWSLAHSSRCYDIFAKSDRFTINVLSEAQRPLSQLFASRGADKFGNAKWAPGLGGVPVLHGALAYMECRKYASYPGGDHTIFVGEVENFQRQPQRPLVFGGGRYMLAIDNLPSGSSIELREGNRARFHAERLAIALLAEIRGQIGQSVAISIWGNEGPVTLYWEIRDDQITTDIQVGHVCSLVDTATGRAFAAFLPPELTNHLRDGHLARTRLTHAEYDLLLAEVRRVGYARVANEKTGLLSLAAPVYDDSGLMMLALTAAMPLTDDRDSDLPLKLLTQAGELSRQLGHRRDGPAPALTSEN